jgi:hypothetical protein
MGVHGAAIATYLREHASDAGGVTVAQVALDVFGLKKPSLGLRTSIGRALHQCGWEAVAQRGARNSSRPRVYRPLRVSPAPPPEPA